MELTFRQDHRLVCPFQIFQMMTQWILGNPNSWISNVNHHLKIQISPRLVNTRSSIAKFHKVDQGRASGMDWTLNLILDKSETSRDIKK